MGLIIRLEDKVVGDWKAMDGGVMTEDEAAQIASDESEKFDAYVEEIYNIGGGKFLAILVKNED